MTINTIPIDHHITGWDAILNDRIPYSTLNNNITVDWLVVGAGFAGLSAAKRLLDKCPNDKVAIVDATSIAKGPAGRNSGFMIDLPHDLASDDYGGQLDKDKNLITLNRYALGYAKKIASDCVMGPDIFNPSGKINAAATLQGMKHNNDYANHLDDMGEDYTHISQDEMRHITGSEYYLGGLYTPGTCIIQPAGYIRTLANHVSTKFTIYDHTPVLNLNKYAGQWVAHTPKGIISAHKVILAVNGHLQFFGYYPKHFVHIFTYASMTRSLSKKEQKLIGGDTMWGVTPADPMGTTVRRFNDRIIVRNTFTYNPTLTTSDSQLASIAQKHDSAFKARFPAISNVSMQYRWGGRLCLSQNNVNAFGELEPNIYAACCQNGLGTVRGTLSGMLSVDDALGEQNQYLTLLKEEGTPKKLPPKFLVNIGVRAKIFMATLKAGKEI